MSEHKIVKVKVDELNPGPIQRDKLPENFYNEALSIYNLISEVDRGGFEKFEENFRRDANYDREIAIWRCIATAYHNFVSARMVISFAEKKAAFRIAIMCSISFSKESKVKGDAVISDEDAKFIYRTYDCMISQTFKNRQNKL